MKILTTRHLLSTALCATLALPAVAQDVLELDEIIVSGSLTPVEAGRTGATVEKLDADALTAAARPVSERLGSLPGVSFTRNGGTGASTNLYIRGLGAQYVGVRINGIDVADPSKTQSQYDFGGLLSFGISSVEVLKGSQSALYGSEAIAGLIDIRTDEAVRPGYTSTAAFEAGSYGTYAGGISTVMESDSGKLSFTLSHLSTDGFSSRASDDEDDGFEQTFLTFGLEQDVSDGLTLGLSGLYRTSETDYDLSDTDPEGETSRDETGLRAFARVTGGAMHHEFSASLFETERSYPGGYTEDYSGRRRNLAYLGTAELSDISSLSVGLDYTEEEFEIDGWDADDRSWSVSGEWLYAAAPTVDLSVALRYDDHSDFGSHVSGRLAAAWRAAPDWTIRAVAGTGFRAPSLFERYSDYGDPGLEEETSRSFELGAERRFGSDSFAKATAFYTEIEDRIDFDTASTACVGGPGCYAQVDGTTVSRGIELSGRYGVGPALALRGNYTYTDAKTEGQRAERVPRHDLVLGLDTLLSDRLTGTVEVQHVADVIPSSYAPADHKVGDYTLVNAGFTYALTAATDLTLRLENLGDEDYETADGYNTPGRSAYVGVRASF
ncbi:TonB-dependent receptor plug domain-containing protein [Celeribacter indicus]|nr:TonB-dependent receptor [Celeribacter indicus]